MQQHTRPPQSSPSQATPPQQSSSQGQRHIMFIFTDSCGFGFAPNTVGKQEANAFRILKIVTPLFRQQASVTRFKRQRTDFSNLEELVFRTSSSNRPSRLCFSARNVSATCLAERGLKRPSLASLRTSRSMSARSKHPKCSRHRTQKPHQRLRSSLHASRLNYNTRRPEQPTCEYPAKAAPPPSKQVCSRAPPASTAGILFPSSNGGICRNRRGGFAAQEHIVSCRNL